MRVLKDSRIAAVNVLGCGVSPLRLVLRVLKGHGGTDDLGGADFLLFLREVSPLRLVLRVLKVSIGTHVIMLAGRVSPLRLVLRVLKVPYCNNLSLSLRLFHPYDSF